MQPAPLQVLRVSTPRRAGIAGPWIEQVAPKPQLRTERADAQCRQGLAAFRACRHGQLVLAQVRQLAIQAIMAAGAEPVLRFLATALLRSEVELDRQFQVMHAIAVTQQHIEFAEGVAVTADRQVGADQFDPRGMAYGELPEPLVVQPQPARGGLGQPVLQGLRIMVQLPQPAFQLLRCLHPVAAGQRMALWPGCIDEHRRRENDPGQVAHFGVAQLSGEVEQAGKQDHSASIAVCFKAERILSQAGFRP